MLYSTGQGGPGSTPLNSGQQEGKTIFADDLMQYGQIILRRIFGGIHMPFSHENGRRLDAAAFG